MNPNAAVFQPTPSSKEIHSRPNANGNSHHNIKHPRSTSAASKNEAADVRTKQNILSMNNAPNAALHSTTTNSKAYATPQPQTLLIYHQMEQLREQGQLYSHHITNVLQPQLTEIANRINSCMAKLEHITDHEYYNQLHQQQLLLTQQIKQHQQQYHAITYQYQYYQQMLLQYQQQCQQQEKQQTIAIIQQSQQPTSHPSPHPQQQQQQQQQHSLQLQQQQSAHTFPAPVPTPHHVHHNHNHNRNAKARTALNGYQQLQRLYDATNENDVGGNIFNFGTVNGNGNEMTQRYNETAPIQKSLPRTKFILNNHNALKVKKATYSKQDIFERKLCAQWEMR